ncbi:toxin-antitoxin system YwqK family antitoxin [Runella sp. SP2]|uniref:toxin-antitoxin system YwqK family antitoxin n=1 Tax=Runella sp. SP2 TaxID=2268026 RepID=UPI000F095A32|nr:hypothetical protein [Runella sp. SP2]AYQ30961.1 hypothetical protein DTQ70_01655 [Runella sp. SP2]
MSENEEELFVEKLYYDNNQIRTETSFNTERLHGPMKGWYENGQPMFSGVWKNGKRHGVWEHIEKDGQKEYFYWHEGKEIRLKVEHLHLMEAFLTNHNYKVESPQQKYEPE